MTLNIFLITILIAVRINYISCLDIHLCENGDEVRDKLREKEYDVDFIPLIVIQNKYAYPFNDQNTINEIQSFYDDKKIPLLLVVPADKCFEIDNLINGGDRRHYPSLFMVKHGRLVSNKKTDMSPSSLEELYYYALYERVQGSQLWSIILNINGQHKRRKLTQGIPYVLKTHTLHNVDPAENPVTNHPYASLNQNMSYQTTGGNASPWNTQPDSEIIEQSAFQARDPVRLPNRRSTKHDSQKFSQKAFRAGNSLSTQLPSSTLIHPKFQPGLTTDSANTNYNKSEWTISDISLTPSDPSADTNKRSRSESSSGSSKPNTKRRR